MKKCCEDPNHSGAILQSYSHHKDWLVKNTDMAEPSATNPSTAMPPAKAEAAPPPPAPLRPIPPALRPLRYMGIPEGVLRWKPKMPSRNWSIFYVVTGTLVSLYAYDRRECARIRQEYVDAVAPLSLEPLASYDYPRKVQVYSAKSPGDEDVRKSIIYFKRYVKPILNAAGIDIETLNGTQHGGVARQLRERVYARRRQLAQLEPWGIKESSSGGSPLVPDSLEANEAQMRLQSPFALNPQQQLQRELEGAVILVGRPAYKEYMWGLQQGWTTPLPAQRQDLDEPLSQELANDDKFDEVPTASTSGTGEGSDASAGAETLKTAVSRPSSTTSMSDLRSDDQLDDIEKRNRALAASADDEGEEDGAGAPLPASRFGTPGAFNPAGSSSSSFGSRNSATTAAKATPAAPNVDQRILAPPAQIPAQPPLAFVDYVNYTGWRTIPSRIVGFFNHRERVRYGGQVALAIAFGDKSTARDFAAPDSSLAPSTPPQGGDLDWGLQGESLYPPRWAKAPQYLADERESYYKDLVTRLNDTRTLVRGQREPTKAEKNDPPKSESALKEERFRKERSWRAEEQGWSILDVASGVAWSDAFRGSLRVIDTNEDPAKVAARGKERIEAKQYSRAEKDAEGKPWLPQMQQSQH
ncbi:unnamed protein product [Jaminaea pallidilutea]